MDPQLINEYLDIIYNIATIIAVLVGSIAAYGILLMSSKPRIIVDYMIHWPKGSFKSINDNYILSAQLRFLNPAIGSKVVTEVVIDRVEIEQIGQKYRMIPIAFLNPIAIKEETNLKTDIEDLIHPFIMVGGGQEVKHVAFIEESGLEYNAGEIDIRIFLKTVVHNPIFRIFGHPKPFYIVINCKRDIEYDDSRILKLKKIFWPNYLLNCNQQND